MFFVLEKPRLHRRNKSNSFIIQFQTLPKMSFSEKVKGKIPRTAIPVLEEYFLSNNKQPSFEELVKIEFDTLLNMPLSMTSVKEIALLQQQIIKNGL